MNTNAEIQHGGHEEHRDHREGNALRIGSDWFGLVRIARQVENENEDDAKEGARGCEGATGCEVACKHWSKVVFAGCEVGVMYRLWSQQVGPSSMAKNKNKF